MPKSRVILVLGVLIALLPVLGFPRSWESFFQVLAGFAIVLLPVWPTSDRMLSVKAKAQLRQTRKRVTDFYPKTGQLGRRVSDLSPTIDEPNLKDDLDNQIN